MAEMLAVMHSSERCFDIAEIRADYLTDLNLRKILSEKACEVIVTLRATRDHGFWTGSESERLTLLQQADELGADYVDIEYDSLSHFQRQGNARLIVSYHNFEETPPNLLDLALQMEQTEGDIIKLATYAHTHEDNRQMIEVIRQLAKPVIGITMGPQGHLLRILGAKLGTYLVFASLAEGSESAPGQVPAGVLLETYGFCRMTPATRIYGLSGFTDNLRMVNTLNQLLRDTDQNVRLVPFASETIEQALTSYQSIPVEGYLLGKELHLPRLVSYSVSATQPTECFYLHQLQGEWTISQELPPPLECLKLIWEKGVISA
jgi:3-dehydroquinate dehydratase type I